MHSFRYTPLIATVLVHIAFTFKPEIQMPFTKVYGYSSEQINRIGSSLTCDEERSSVKDCATDCTASTTCPGFYTESSGNVACKICHVSSSSEIQGNSFTAFQDGDEIFVRKSLQPTPEVALNFDKYTETEFLGEATLGTMVDIEESDHVSGVKGQGLYVHGGSHVILTGSGSECWNNMDYCTSGFSASIWFQARAQHTTNPHILGTGASYDKGFNFQLQANSHEFHFKTFTSTKRYSKTSPQTATLNIWYHLVGIFNGNDDVELFIDGVENGRSTSTGSISASDSQGYGAHVGVQYYSKNSHTDGYVDAFKFYYRVLADIGIGFLWVPAVATI